MEEEERSWKPPVPLGLESLNSPAISEAPRLVLLSSDTSCLNSARGY